VASPWQVVEIDGRRRRVAFARDAQSIWMFMDGRVWTIPATTEGPARSKKRGGHDVMAPMPATVVAINAALGQTVNEGETVIVLEAMKMELPIKAPRTGTVTAITCARGELVQPGVNLIEIE
jgi:biotin carboxyl carrier protein